MVNAAGVCMEVEGVADGVELWGFDMIDLEDEHHLFLFFLAEVDYFGAWFYLPELTALPFRLLRTRWSLNWLVRLFFLFCHLLRLLSSLRLAWRCGTHDYDIGAGFMIGALGCWLFVIWCRGEELHPLELWVGQGKEYCFYLLVSWMLGGVSKVEAFWGDSGVLEEGLLERAGGGAGWDWFSSKAAWKHEQISIITLSKLIYVYYIFEQNLLKARDTPHPHQGFEHMQLWGIFIAWSYCSKVIF